MGSRSRVFASRCGVDLHADKLVTASVPLGERSEEGRIGAGRLQHAAAGLGGMRQVNHERDKFRWGVDDAQRLL